MGSRADSGNPEEPRVRKKPIVIFGSDNGPERYAFNRAEKYQHFSMGELRGLKRDVWEGGHHVPFIMKWPGEIEAGSVSDEVSSQVHIRATVAAILDVDLPEGERMAVTTCCPSLPSRNKIRRYERLLFITPTKAFGV